jgi:hypothetical protein
MAKPFREAGPEVELVLGGVVDRPDAIRSRRQGLHVLHGPGIIEGVPWRQVGAVGVAGSREVLVHGRWWNAREERGEALPSELSHHLQPDA